MALEVQILTGRKGSNPGGICNIVMPPRAIPCYMKYCPGSHLPRNSNLSATHQPIYEAITNVFARKVGLLTPKTHVLVDTNDDVKFTRLNGDREGLGEGRRYYFVSELITADESKNGDLLKKTVEEEGTYLDLLGICDVFDKRDNFFFYENGGGRIFYVDLGCSFVRAKEGWIEIKNKDKRELENRAGIKRTRKELANYSIVPIYGGPNVNIVGLIESLPGINISTFNPEGITPVSRLLSLQEIAEIQDILTLEMGRGLRKYRKTHPNMLVRT